MQRFSSILWLVMLVPPALLCQDMTSGASPMRGERPVGYLQTDEYPDGIALLPAPPTPGTPAMSLDRTLNDQALKLRGSARWKQAARDALPVPGRTFACALGMSVTADTAPVLSAMLLRIGADAGGVVTPVKQHYERPRPFMVNDQPTCVPMSPERGRPDSSYPSGHTVAGWAWALVLTELVPERTDAILARGWAFGQSRAVCNVHWQSDVTQGRVLAATLVARLHADREFRADLERARAEITGLRSKASPGDVDCEAEAAALAGL